MQKSNCSLVLFVPNGFLVVLLFSLFSLMANAAFARDDSDSTASLNANATLVIYNSADVVSHQLADYYAKKRHIPPGQVVGLSCAPNETISRKQYDDELANPLRKLFTKRGWWKTAEDANGRLHVIENKIRFVALIKGIPLRIAPLGKDEKYAGDHVNGPLPIGNRNEACVDSELAALGYETRIISGAIPNPYYDNFQPIRDAHIPPLMLVCRLDAPTSTIVRQMIDGSLLAEKNGLWGFCYIDKRGLKPGNPLFAGDEWMDSAASNARKNGMPTIVNDRPETFSIGYPMRHAALYYGWYAHNVCGPFLQPGFQFQPGAIAVHIYSYSADSLRTPNKFWCAPLLVRGAAATLGNVYEPYLVLTPHLNIFQQRLGEGFTFAESAYMSLKAISWMTTVVGDPLYRPYHVWTDPSATPHPPSSKRSEWKAYESGVKIWKKQSHAAGARALESSAKKLHSGLIYEGLGLLEESELNSKKALAAFREAEKNYANDEDRARNAIHQARLLQSLGEKEKALEVCEKSARKYASTDAASVFELIHNEIEPPPKPKPNPQAIPIYKSR